METEGRRGREKLSKEEKKANKRTNKARVTLFKRDGVHLSSEPTVVLTIYKVLENFSIITHMHVASVQCVFTIRDN